MRTATIFVMAALLAVGTWAVFVSAEDQAPEQASPATAAAGTQVASTEWTQWRGPGGDGIVRVKGLATSWPDDGPKELWSDEVGRGYSSPVGRDGRVYLFHTENERDTLTCYDAASGKQHYEKSYKSAWLQQYPGTRATPVIEGDYIYTYGGAGDLVCWRVRDGQHVWHTNLLKETSTRNLRWGMASSPLLDGDRLYVQVGSGGPAAVAVNKKDGSIVWKSTPGNQGGYAPIIAIDVDGVKQLVVFGGTAVMGLDPANGKTIWSEPWKTSYDVNAATPIYRDGHLFITSGYGTGCMMLKFDGQKAVEQSRQKSPHSKFPSPILDGDYLYANNENELMCLKWPTLKEVWTCDERSMRLGPGGSFVRFDDMLITMSERGKLSLLQADPKGYKVVSQTQMFRDNDVWSSPTIYGKRLYVKGAGKFVCLDIAAD